MSDSPCSIVIALICQQIRKLVSYTRVTHLFYVSLSPISKSGVRRCRTVTLHTSFNINICSIRIRRRPYRSLRCSFSNLHHYNLHCHTAAKKLSPKDEDVKIMKLEFNNVTLLDVGCMQSAVFRLISNGKILYVT